MYICVMAAKIQKSLESQIFALEMQLSKAVSSGKPQQQLFALNGKIKKLKKKLQEKSWNKFLSK